MSEVTIMISPDGSEVKADAVGFSGKACNKYLDQIKALGGDVTEKKKPEYNKSSSGTTNKA